MVPDRAYLPSHYRSRQTKMSLSLPVLIKQSIWYNALECMVIEHSLLPQNTVLLITATSTCFVQGPELCKVVLGSMPMRRQGYKGRDWKRGCSHCRGKFFYCCYSFWFNCLLLIYGLNISLLLRRFNWTYLVLFLPSHTSSLQAANSSWARFNS